MNISLAWSQVSFEMNLKNKQIETEGDGMKNDEYILGGFMYCATCSTHHQDGLEHVCKNEKMKMLQDCIRRIEQLEEQIAMVVATQHDMIFPTTMDEER